MIVNEAIKWFKTTFHKKIADAIHGSPFSVDTISAIAYQETGYLWAPLIEKLDVSDLLKLCR